MEKIKHNRLLMLILGVLIVLVIAISAIAIKKLVPSKKVMDLKEYYKVDSDKVMVILQNKVSDEQEIGRAHV